jgi:hypothetical protein
MNPRYGFGGIGSFAAPISKNNMVGVTVFKSLADALRAGFQIYDRTSEGYLVRTKTDNGWAMALVTCKD